MSPEGRQWTLESEVEGWWDCGGDMGGCGWGYEGDYGDLYSHFLMYIQISLNALILGLEVPVYQASFKYV